MTAELLEVMTPVLASSERSEAAVKTQLERLKSRYDEPWRHYHVFDHPEALLHLLREQMPVIRNPRAVGWAMLYHDVIYDPTASPGRNEELSAQLAESELPSLVGHDTTAIVARYARATAGHDADNSDADLDFFLDADLVILGSDPGTYDQYAANVRLEYGHVPEDAYRLGRIAALEGLAGRVEQRGLYRTEMFRELYEAQSQANMAREIDHLRQLAA